MRNTLADQNRHYVTVARAIEYLRANAKQQPSLSEVAASVHLSQYHLQRLFTAWAGISPKRFLQFLTKEYARQALQQSNDNLMTTQEIGLSSPGRLHDLMITCEAMTPGEIRQGGYGVKLTYGMTDSPFGSALIAWTPRGICHLAFCDTDAEAEIFALLSQWKAAVYRRDDVGASDLSERIFSSASHSGKLHLLLRGTNFQIKVWEALLNIGSSQLISYATLARMAGSPRAQRAVGSALAANKIAYLIPCHRVIRENGEIGQYRSGKIRKIALQAWEAAKHEI